MAALVPVPSFQKAWIYKEYGPGKDVLRLEERVPVPEPAPDQVLLKVQAASLNPIDSKRRDGAFKAVDSELPHVPGYDVSGVIVKLGADVKGFKEGDEVYADVHESSVVKPKRFGTLAEYTAVEERLIALKPKNLSFTDAASLPVAILTAQGVFEQGKLKAGQSVLVLGGAGGVGSMAIQVAKKVYGAAMVATTASTRKLGFVKSLGADIAIDYTTTNYWDLPDKYDFVFDTVGESAKASKALKNGGVGGSIAEFGDLPPNFFVYNLIPSGSNLSKLTPYIESGEVKPVRDPTSPYKFTEVQEAFAHLETGRAIGKITIEL